MNDNDPIDISSNIPDDEYQDISSSSPSPDKKRRYFEDIDSNSKSKRTSADKYKDISSNTSRRRRRKAKKANRSLTRRILSASWKVLASAFLVCVITGSIVVTALTVYVMKFVDPDSDIDLYQLRLGQNTTVFALDSDDEWVSVQELSNGRKYEWVDLEDIPYEVQDAFVYTEDQRFREHNGVDWKRTFGAFVNMFVDIYGFRQGGSTITQQLIKNITDETDVTVQRKIQEIFRAINLEKRYSKDEILEAYLNVIYLGYNTYGVQAASKLYFNKDVKDLTTLEASALAAMTRNPSGYDPFEYPEKNKDRREYVLKQLKTYNVITEDEYSELLVADLETERGEVQAAGSESTGVQSYFVDNLISEVVVDLMDEKGWSEETAEAKLTENGYRIYTTLDIDTQSILEKRYQMNSTFSSVKMSDPPESAMIIMDHYGAIKAVVGGRGEKKISRGLNRATQSIRSPGSSIKPLAVYAPAIENDLITYSTIMKDEPIETVIGGKTVKWPSNYTKKNYGSVTVEFAIRRSLNTIPVKIVEQMGASASFKFVTKKLGLSTLKKSWNIDGETQSDATLGGLAMGDFVYGTKLSELTAAYQIFANGGTYTAPHSYTSVTTSAGEVVLSHEEDESTRVISKETAGVMNKLLQQVVESYDGTGTYAKLDGITVVGKTGTSNTYNDQLFIGLTPYYIAGVWFGYDDPKSLEGIGMNSPALIWKNVMSKVLADKKDKTFKIASSVKKYSYCTSTGLLANSRCPDTRTGYYKSSNVPDTCTAH